MTSATRWHSSRSWLVAALLVAAAGQARAADEVYYRVERDQRLCPAPLCGGYWVSALNQPLTSCLDGTSAARCYVASLVGVPVPDRPPFGVARGTIESFPPQGNLGQLRVAAAWVPLFWPPLQQAPAVDEQFFLFQRTGIVCTTSPCPYFRVTEVNGGGSSLASDLELPPEVSSYRRSIETRARGGLIVSGELETYQETPPGVAMNASEVFVPVQACSSDTDCFSYERCTAGFCAVPRSVPALSVPGAALFGLALFASALLAGRRHRARGP